MSCASCGYTHSPRKNVNQALNHLHILLLSCLIFQGPYGNHDLCSTPIRVQNSLPPLAAHPHALFSHCFLPASLGPDVLCLSPGSAQRLQMRLNPARISGSQFGTCFSPFSCLLGRGSISVLLRLTLSPRCLSSPHLDAVVLAKPLHSE